MKTAAIIPARFASTRFPGKPLALILGKPMIRWVYEACQSSELFDYTIVATDSPEIMQAVASFGGDCRMTSPHHQSGTDRIAEVAQSLDAEIIVNVQGDEPLIEQTCLAELLQAFSDPDVGVASLKTAITETEDLQNPNVVKVVTDYRGDAIYFSRSAIPFNRDNCSTNYFRHIGVYAYRKASLLKFINLPPSRLEQVEKLEQLRLLENGIKLRMIPTDYQGIGIDSPQDLPVVEAILNLRNLQ